MNLLVAPVAAICVAAALAAPALAHPGKHPGRPGQHHARHDGGCDIERKIDHKGRLKEKSRCHGYALRGLQPPAPYGAAPAPGIYVQPPALVIQPPALVIR